MILKCRPEAFAKCPTRHICGSPNDATFMEGSECDQFNQSVMDSPMTNGDWMRALPDEELAEFIGRACLCERIRGESNWCEQRTSCEKCMTEWLQQPVEGGCIVDSL